MLTFAFLASVLLVDVSTATGVVESPLSGLHLASDAAAVCLQECCLKLIQGEIFSNCDIVREDGSPALAVDGGDGGGGDSGSSDRFDHGTGDFSFPPPCTDSCACAASCFVDNPQPTDCPTFCSYMAPSGCSGGTCDESTQGLLAAVAGLTCDCS